MASYCNMVTPAAGGGYACGFLVAKEATAGQPLCMGNLSRDETSDVFATTPDTTWTEFTNPGYVCEAIIHLRISVHVRRWVYVGCAFY